MAASAAMDVGKSLRMLTQPPARTPADRRQNVITLTPQGRQQLHNLDQALAHVEDEVLAPLTPAERQQLAQLLTTLVDHHGRNM